MLPLRIFAVSILVLMVSSAAASPAISIDNSVTVKSHRPFDYVVVIVMENHNRDEIYNCGGVCSFLAQFADAHAFSTNFRSTFNGSLASYFALTMGKHNVLGGQEGVECSPDPNQNPASHLQYCPQDFKNIVDIVEGGGFAWKVYSEDYPTTCGNKCSPGNCFVGYDAPGMNNYAGSHNTFVYFTNIVNNTNRCSRIVPANSVVDLSNPETDDVLINDLQSSSTAPNFMWLMPNECDQMHHDCLGGTDPTTQEANQVTWGSNYLENMLPKILNTPVFQTQRAAVFITFDECQNIITNNCSIDGFSTNRIYTLWASASGLGPVKEIFKSNTSYNHYSFLSTLEWAWNLPPLTTNDRTATIMKEFFT